MESTNSERPELLWAHSGPKCLALVSWRGLLDQFSGALERADDRIHAADVRQLRGLCERMDADAFLPFRSEDLTSDIGRLVLQFGQIVGTLAEHLVSRGDGDTKGLRPTAGNGWYGRYIRLRGYAGLISYSLDIWKRHGTSPIWLAVKGPDWKRSEAVVAALESSGIAFHEADSWCWIAIRLPTGVERDAVISHALDQISAVLDVLPPADPALKVNREQLTGSDELEEIGPMNAESIAGENSP